MDKPRVLLIDDDEAFLELFVSLDEAEDFEIVPLSSGNRALEILGNESVDLVVTDIQMPEMTGTELFAEIQDRFPDVPVILITAFGSTEKAIQLVKNGAFHYFEKPLESSLDLIWATFREALAKRRMLKELASLRRERSLAIKSPVTIIGQSEPIRNIMSAVEEVADIPVSVLICGETGTGKELVARAIHALSDRRDNSFLAINCNEFAAGVLESELFGHEKGAFTGATERKVGIFDVVHKGSLFLDEIGDAPRYFQSKLLRVLDSKYFMRVGGTTPIFSDFRLLVATNCDLEREVEKGCFRQDLYYRLNVYRIDISPLRERRDDIPLIAEFYLKRLSEAYRRPAESISTNAMLFLREYGWPGNVRELINVMERAVITCREKMITTEHLPFKTGDYESLSDLNLKDAEKFFVGLAMRRTGNNKTQAAELLGISRKTLIEKVKGYDLEETGEA